MTTLPTNLDSVTDERDQRLLLAIGVELARSDGPFNQVTSTIAVHTDGYTLVVKGLQNIFGPTLTPRLWKIPPNDKPRVTMAKYSVAEGGVVVTVKNKLAYDAMCSMEQRAQSSGSLEASRPVKRKRDS